MWTVIIEVVTDCLLLLIILLTISNKVLMIYDQTTRNTRPFPLPRRRNEIYMMMNEEPLLGLERSPTVKNKQSREKTLETTLGVHARSDSERSKLLTTVNLFRSLPLSLNVAELLVD